METNQILEQVTVEKNIGFELDGHNVQVIPKITGSKLDFQLFEGDLYHGKIGGVWDRNADGSSRFNAEIIRNEFSPVLIGKEDSRRIHKLTATALAEITLQYGLPQVYADGRFTNGSREIWRTLREWATKEELHSPYYGRFRIEERDTDRGFGDIYTQYWLIPAPLK